MKMLRDMNFKFLYGFVIKSFLDYYGAISRKEVVKKLSSWC